MSNSTATDSSDANVFQQEKSASSLVVDPIVLIAGGALIIVMAIYIFYTKFTQASKNSTSKQDVEDNPSVADFERGISNSSLRSGKPSLRSRSKSVRWVDEVSQSGTVTPQSVPDANVAIDLAETPSTNPGTPGQTHIGSVFKRFTRSLVSLMSDDISVPMEDEESETPDSAGFEDIPEVPMGKRTVDKAHTDDIECMKIEMLSPRTRSISLPAKTDKNNFFVGEEVEYRSKNRWKRGFVTAINPLKVKGEDNYRSKQYDEVRKLRAMPLIGEEVDTMDVEEMTHEDFVNIMQSARRNTIHGRAALTKAMQSQSNLVRTVTKG